MTDETTQAKLDKLDKFEKANRERARRYLKQVKKEGKKQLSAIISGKAYNQLCRIRDKALQNGKPTSFGEIIENALDCYTNNQTEINATLNDNDYDNNNDNINVNDINSNNDNINAKNDDQGEPDPGKTLSVSELDKLVLKAGEDYKKNQDRADFLNRNGISQKNGKQWDKVSVGRYLSNARTRMKSQKSQGEKMKVKIDEDSWNAGYNAGYNGEPNQEPEGMDEYSFCSGYIEGKARADNPRGIDEAFSEG